MNYDVSREWKILADEVIHPNNVIMVIGKVDTGKSTLCRFLAEIAVDRDLTVGLVDADVGQSWIGPPTTIGMKVLNSTFVSVAKAELRRKRRDELDSFADSLYFVGSLSPERHLLQCVTGTKLMVDAALDKGTQVVIIDTTGLIASPIGVVLKQHKIELVRPDHLVCVQHMRELTPIIESYGYTKAFQIHRVERSKSVVRKSTEERRRFRQERFEEYFRNYELKEIPFDQFRGQGISFFNGREVKSKELEIISDVLEERAVYAERSHKSLSIATIDNVSDFSRRRVMSHFGLNYVEVREIDYFERFLVALMDEFADVMSIGIVDSVDFHNRLLKVKCRPGSSKQTRLVKFGDYKMP